jgi:hypothetical protein
VKPFSPITPRKGSLDKQRADDIVNGANDVFDFTILRGHVSTRHLELCLFGQKKGLGGKIVKLMPVVALDDLDGAAEQSSNIRKEVGQCSEDARFKFKWKSLKIKSKIIKNDQIILRT